MSAAGSDGSRSKPVRLAYLVSHPIQYQAPLLRRIAQEPDIDLTVFFGSDFSVRAYKDAGFGVEVAWDIPLTQGYKHIFLHPLRDTGEVSMWNPMSRGLYGLLGGQAGCPAFDVLWVHGYASINSLQGLLIAKALGIPVLLRAESWLEDRERSVAKLMIKGWLFRALSCLVAATLPIGKRNAEYWAHYFGTRMPQFLMPYAVDNSFFAQKALAAATTEQELRLELGLAADRPVILFASKLQTRKHCDHLLQAYAALLQMKSADDLTPYLVIVGDGEERASLEAAAKNLGLADVRFAGFQNQSALPRYLQLADVFVLPSRHEPWGLIVNEAMASGCAVITSDHVGSHLDLITNGVEGFVFPFGDVSALTKALQSIFATPEIARDMGAKAAARIAAWSFEEDVQGLRAAIAHVTRSCARSISAPCGECRTVS